MRLRLAGLIVIAALAACGSDKRQEGPRVKIVYSIDLEKPVDELRANPTDVVDEQQAAEVRRKALAQAVETIRKRIDSGGVAGARVASEGEQIVVELPAIDDDRSSALRDLISRTGALSLKLVDNDSPFMRQVFIRVGRAPGSDEASDPEARALGIKGISDAWDFGGPAGALFVDHALTASDRESVVPVEEARRLGCLHAASPMAGGTVACRVSGRQVLERYLTGLGQLDPALRVPDDRQLGYELLEQDGQRPVWRTYLLVRAAPLTGRDLAKVELVRSPASGRPEIAVTFDAAGKQKLAELTRGALGKKVAIIVDDLVHSAPIVQSAITGGTLRITMGGADLEAQQRDARELVEVLRAGSLPAPLMEESRTELGPR